MLNRWFLLPSKKNITAKKQEASRIEFSKQVFMAKSQEAIIGLHVSNALSFAGKFIAENQCVAIAEYIERAELRGPLADVVYNRAVAALDQQL